MKAALKRAAKKERAKVECDAPQAEKKKPVPASVRAIFATASQNARRRRAPQDSGTRPFAPRRSATVKGTSCPLRINFNVTNFSRRVGMPAQRRRRATKKRKGYCKSVSWSFSHINLCVAFSQTRAAL